MTNEFIPLAQTQDEKYSIASNEASRIARPFQGSNSAPFFWIERKGDVYGAVRNLSLAGRNQDQMFELLKANAIGAIV